ncbi:MAG: glutamine amidotransferase [Lacisediminihabitans sp.]
MTTTVTLLQLYPDELGVAGDRGNVMALTTRLQRGGVEVLVVRHSVGDELLTAPDLVVVGSGPISAIRNIYSDLVSHSAALTSMASSGVPFFAYGAGAELLGRSIRLVDGTELAGLGIFPFTTVRIDQHRVGYVLVDSSVGRLAGFEDNASLWQLQPGAVALGTLVAGNGNSDGKYEGVRVGASIATQIGGPVLPLNPALTDALIAVVAERNGFGYAPENVHTPLDHYAAKARDVIIDNVKHVFSRI